MHKVNQVRAHVIKRLDTFRGRFYDFIHDVDTFSFVSRRDVRIESENREFGFAYQGTPARTIHTLFDRLDCSEDTTFIDFGCGKGVALIAAAKHSFRKIIGVEYSSDLVDIARRNVIRYRGRLRSRKNILIVHGDATQFSFPPTPLVCYFYNPFLPVVMETVLENLVASWREYPREIRLVFHIRYPRELVLSKFRMLKFEAIPYFHLYQVASAKERQENEQGENRVWETIDTESYRSAIPG
jgi:SAM-dependent methyltransferase